MSHPKQSYSRWRFIKAYLITFVILARYIRLMLLAKLISTQRLESLLEKAHEKTAKQIVKALLQLRGLYIKIGQTLSVLGNILPEKFAGGLESLQDAVPGHPFEEIEQRFIDDFGRSSHQLFHKVEREPIASASLGQVHVAEMADHSKWAVKIQYPGIEDITRKDIKTIRNIFGIIHFFFPRYNFKDVVEEAAQIILKELDYKQEARNIDLISKTYSSDTNLIFPKVHSQISSSKVLTTSFIEGTKITNIEQLKKWGIDRRELAVRLIHFYCKQVFVDGIYHADPHPGNIIISPEGKIGMVDFGAVAQISSSMRQGLTQFVEGLIKKDTRLISHAIRLMGFVAKNDDEQTLERVVDYFYSKITAIKIQSFRNLDISQFQNLSDIVELKRMNISFRELATLFVIPRDWILLERTMLLLMGLTAQLDETLNPVEIIIPYVEKFLLSDRNVAEIILSASKDLILSYISLPSEMVKTLKKINNGQTTFSVRDFKKEITSVKRRIGTLTMSILAGITGSLSFFAATHSLTPLAFRLEIAFYVLSGLTVLSLLRR